MSLKLAHISDLSGMYFNIPDYQRGYRWETKQVTDLLDDLFEFQTTASKASNFYCLQPLVVTKNSNVNTDEGNEVFDVIDGQQRLTTLFLIMNILKLDGLYHLRFERATKTNSDKFTEGEQYFAYLEKLSDEDISNNSDYFYISQAIKDIKEWIEEKKKSYPKIERKLEDVLCHPDYETPRKIFYQEDVDGNDALNDVRFIWYDVSVSEKITYKSSIDIFERLNEGKTELTAAELIKALLFQCDIYDENIRPEMKQIAFRMSTEWDAMEKKLQDNFLWSMFMSNDYNKPSRIDIVLSYVARELKKSLEIKASENDDDYDYIVFNTYIKKKVENENLPYEDVVKELWSKIQDTFATIKNWYEDRELYHLVGLYFILANGNVLVNLRNLISDFENFDRNVFVNKLKEEKIGSLIKLKGVDKNTQMPLSLENICYGDHNKEIEKILLLYNVDLSMRCGQNKQYFPFNFYKNKRFVPSLEHIHPQHMADDDLKFETKCNWFANKVKSLNTISFPDNEQKELIDNAVAELKKVLIEGKEKEYESEKAKYSHLLNKIDKYFDELANIDDKELHSIRNMALVDKDTNASLGNGFIYEKRMKLQERSTLYENSNCEQGAATFVGTWKVFNKEYCTEETSANLMFWTKNDRQNYYNEIKKTYESYAK